MSIPAQSDVASDLYKVIQYAEIQLGGAAVIELDQDGIPKSSWMIPFRGSQLTIHPFVDAQSTVQIMVYVGRDTTVGRRGKIIWSLNPALYSRRSGYGKLRGEDLLRAVDDVVKFLQARPIKQDWRWNDD